MGKKSSPSIPEPPSFQANPNVGPNIDFLSDVGQGLGRGNFLNESDPLLGFLAPLTQINPEATQAAVDLASRDVIRMRDRAQQDILNQLEANNQLTGSTTANRLGDLNEQFSSDISDIATNFYLADVERSMTNTGNLFQLGLGTTSDATNLGLSDQGQRNEFALQNFNNQVAASMAAQQSGSGGFLGGGLGTLIGGGAGFLFGGPAGAAIGAGLGGSVGSGIGEAFSPSISGAAPGAFTQAGFSLAGNALGDRGLSNRDFLFGQRKQLGVA